MDTIEVSELTQEINDEGNVQVYLHTQTAFGGDPEVWNPLPYEILAFGSEYYYNFDYAYEVGQIILYYYYSPNDSDYTTPDLSNADLPDYKFKYVLTAPSTTQSMEDAGVNWDNHDEVMNYLERHAK